MADDQPTPAAGAIKDWLADHPTVSHALAVIATAAVAALLSYLGVSVPQ